MITRRRTAALLALAVGCSACSGDDGGSSAASTSPSVETVAPTSAPPATDPPPETTAVADSTYRAEITYTQHGIPHIVADDLASVAYGQGWAMAADHGCTIVDQVWKVRGERSRWHGAGPDDSYLHSDIVYQALDLVGVGEAVVPTLPDDAQAMLTGFAAGVDRFITDAGSDGMVGWCAGTEWATTTITAAEVYAYVRDFALVGGTRNLVDYIATAAPPEAAAEEGASGTGDGEAALAPVVGIGSNAWAIGEEHADDAASILVGNPHFPWEGELRFWESHLTVPGELDVYGTTPIGVPGIVLGFNEHIAWTRTVSAGRRFTGYQLTLDPNDPTAYVYGDSIEPMTPVEVSVEVLDGSTTRTEQRTLWRTRYGLVLELPGGDWTAERAYAVRDANLANDVMVQMVLGEMRAASIEDFEQTQRDFGGNPFANTIVAAADGRVVYYDTAVTPMISDESIARWQERKAADGFVQLLDRQRVTLLDGSDPRDEWVVDERAPVPGTVPFDLLPQLERTDYVLNANDSYWLANPEAPQTGLSIMHGPAEVPQSARTRRNLITMSGVGTPGSASGDDAAWTSEELWDAVLSNEGLEARLLREPVVERCRANGGPSLQEVCDVLDAWNGRSDLDAPGAVLWREFVSQFPWDDHIQAGTLWEVPFDPADPINTPRGLAPVAADAPDQIITALVEAVEVLSAAGLALDATLADTQYFPVGPDRSERIPVHGAGPFEGIENIVGFSPGSHATEPTIPKGEVLEGSFELSADGYPLNYGTSFLFIVAFRADGPEGRAVLTYGQSGDPTDEHSRDQMELFSSKTWRETWFRAADVAANAVGDPIVISGD